MTRSRNDSRLAESDFATQGPYRWLAGALGAQRQALESALASLESAERDTEAVHDVRVSTRRIRGILDAGGEFLTGRAARRLARRLRDVRRELGGPREAEVGAALLVKRRGALSGPTRTAAAALAAQLLARRDQFKAESDDLVAHLDLRRLRRGLSRVLQDLEGREWPPTGEDPMSLAEFRRRALAVLHERWMVLTETPLEPLLRHDVEAQHDFRIKGKKLRYALELFSPLFPRAIERRIALIKSMQDQLGHLHDLADLANESRTLGARARTAGFAAEAAAFDDLADILDAERHQGLDGFAPLHKALVHPGFLPPAGGRPQDVPMTAAVNAAPEVPVTAAVTAAPDVPVSAAVNAAPEVPATRAPDAPVAAEVPLSGPAETPPSESVVAAKPPSLRLVGGGHEDPA